MIKLLKSVLAITGIAISIGNAHAGRWLSRDPIQDGAGFVQRDAMPEMDFAPMQQNRPEPNLYAFVLNDPLNQIDPLGLLTVGFYGADLWWTFPNAGNQEMDRIGQAVGASKMFHSLSHEAAFQYVLKQLDKNGDGKYDSCDGKEPIKIFGWSWGGISAAKLARKIQDSDKFRIKDVEIVATIDPVATLRLPPTSVPSNVAFVWNRYQRHGRGVPLPFHGRELRIDNPGTTASDQIQMDPNGRDLNYDHVLIVFRVSQDIINVLK